MNTKSGLDLEVFLTHSNYSKRVSRVSCSAIISPNTHTCTLIAWHAHIYSTHVRKSFHNHSHCPIPGFVMCFVRRYGAKVWLLGKNHSFQAVYLLCPRIFSGTNVRACVCVLESVPWMCADFYLHTLCVCVSGICIVLNYWSLVCIYWIVCIACATVCCTFFLLDGKFCFFFLTKTHSLDLSSALSPVWEKAVWMFFFLRLSILRRCHNFYEIHILILFSSNHGQCSVRFLCNCSLLWLPFSLSLSQSVSLLFDCYSFFSTPKSWLCVFYSPMHSVSIEDDEIQAQSTATISINYSFKYNNEIGWPEFGITQCNMNGEQKHQQQFRSVVKEPKGGGKHERVRNGDGLHQNYSNFVKTTKMTIPVYYISSSSFRLAIYSQSSWLAVFLFPTLISFFKHTFIWNIHGKILIWWNMWFISVASNTVPEDV